MAATIFALATARGKAGVAIIRVSGPGALGSLVAFGVAGVLPRVATLRKLRRFDEVIDEAIVVHFPVGQSFTGETVVEYQLHGSTAVVGEVLRVLAGIEGLRPATAGEFTRRALENGVLDLTQVEGLADLIDAETEVQRRQAQRVLSGAIGKKVDGWRRNLIRASALIEATIDFSEDELPRALLGEVSAVLGGLRTEFTIELDASRVSERVRDGFEVALIGAPNSGKSSLLNALAGREAAITSSIPGTTRDIIEVRMDIGGLPVTLLDTAGLRETSDEIEKIGVDRAMSRASAADLRVLLVEPGHEPAVFDLRPGDLVIYTKADLFPGVGQLSSKTGAGIGDLLKIIEKVLEIRVGSAGILIRERQRIALDQALQSVISAMGWLDGVESCTEFVAADLLSAVQALEYLVGKIGVESLLDEIFVSFCIGK